MLETFRKSPVSSVHQCLARVIFSSQFFRLRRWLVNLIRTIVVQLEIESTYLAFAVWEATNSSFSLLVWLITLIVVIETYFLVGNVEYPVISIFVFPERTSSVHLLASGILSSNMCVGRWEYLEFLYLRRNVNIDRHIIFNVLFQVLVTSCRGWLFEFLAFALAWALSCVVVMPERRSDIFLRFLVHLILYYMSSVDLVLLSVLIAWEDPLYSLQYLISYILIIPLARLQINRTPQCGAVTPPIWMHPLSRPAHCVLQVSRARLKEDGRDRAAWFARLGQAEVVVVWEFLHTYEIEQVEYITEDRLVLVVLDLRRLQSLAHMHLELCLVDLQLFL